MHFPWLLTAFFLAARLATGADVLPRPARPPVLRNVEPADTSIVKLPGPAVRAAAVAGRETGDREIRGSDAGAALTPQAVPGGFTAEFSRDPGIFCQNQIGRWSENDARRLLGNPARRRPASDDDGSDRKGGHILAFSDPTARYREIELDFSRDTGLLRAVFAYPKDLSWQECRRIWSGSFTATEANKGRTFYSYTARHLDVLVDAAGHVISLGLY